MKDREPIIKKMPDKETLEDFIKGLSGSVTVVFNTERGEFERVRPVDIDTSETGRVSRKDD